MVIKYCLNGEIHKTFTPPITFVALLDEISSVYEDKLPSLFTLQYKDAEGDIITISSDAEYQSILKYELARTTQSIKIYVLPNKKVLSPPKKTPTGEDKSFEVVSDSVSSCSSHSIIDRGASEISLSEGKLTPRSRSKSPSNRSESSSSSSEENVQEERVTLPYTLPQKINLDGTQEDTYEEGNNDQSNVHDETLARLEARAATLKEQIELFYAMADNIENVLQRDQFENSLERAISELESLNGKTPELQKASLSQYQSVENSVLSKEIDEAVEEMTAKKLRSIIRRIMDLDNMHTEGDDELPSASEPSEIYETRPQALLNLLNIRRRQAKTIKNQAALMIQNAYRGYRLRKMLNNYVQAKPSYIDSEYERHEKLARTKEQISKLIQNTLSHQLADRLQVYKNLRLDCLSENDHHEDSDHNSSLAEEDWKLEDIQTRDCRDSEPKSASDNDNDNDNGTIFDDSIDKASPSERKCRQCRDFEYCEHCASFSKPSDDYVRCRLELGDEEVEEQEQEQDDYEPPQQDESLQTPDTNLINRIYEEILELEARETQQQQEGYYNFKEQQQQGSFDFLVVNDMKSNVLVFPSNEGKKLVYKTVCIENTGTKPWRKCYIKAVGQFEAKTQEVYNVGVGQVIVVTLEFNDYFYAGPYTSQWKLIHETENGVMEVIGKPFDVDFIIRWRESFNDSFFKEETGEGEGYQPIEETEGYIYESIKGDYCDQEEGRQGYENDFAEEKYEEKTEEEEEEESSRQGDYTAEVDVTFAKYINYREELAKVREIRKIFPDDDLDEIVEFVEENDELSMDRLLVFYIRMRNGFRTLDIDDV